METAWFIFAWFVLLVVWYGIANWVAYLKRLADARDKEVQQAIQATEIDPDKNYLFSLPEN